MFSAVQYWFSKYGISVNIKENKEIIIAADGWYKKSTCFIGAYFDSDGLIINLSVTSTQTYCFFL